MKPPKLTELEHLALRCGSYGGIPTHKLKAARERARKKLADPRNVICHNFAFGPWEGGIGKTFRHSINYRKSGDDVVKAYAKWRDERKDETHHAVSFVAGFNAARA